MKVLPMVPKEKSIAIVEDDFFQAEGIERDLISWKYPVFGIYDSGETFLESLHGQGRAPAITLLDIGLAGEMTGFDVARELNALTESAIVFITSRATPEEYGQILAAKPSAILTKPYDPGELHLAILLAQSRQEQRHRESWGQLSDTRNDHQFRFIKVGSNHRKVNLSDILWIEGSGSYAEMVVSGQHLILARNLKDIEQLLDYPSLVRVHRSFLVNVNHVTEIGKENLWLGETEIPMSRAGKQRLRERFSLL